MLRNLGKRIIKPGVGGVWIQFLGSQGARARLVLNLRECIWDAPAVSLVLPVFEDVSSGGILQARWAILSPLFHPG